MSRPNQGPKLVLRKQNRCKTSVYLIRWYKDGRKFERSTGTNDCRAAQEAYTQFLGDQYRKPDGPRRPDELTCADVLAIYGDEHGPMTKAQERLGHAIAALNKFWGPCAVADVKGETCRRYSRHRGKAANTIRRELSVLRAAMNYCVKEGYLTTAQPVWLPPRGNPRDRWLTRKEAAQLLRAARADKTRRLHLPLFILIGLYTGSRKDAILKLQWFPNLQGGWVDLKNGVIDFNGPRQRTKKQRPRIPIPPRLMRFLKLARKRTHHHVIEIDGNPVGNIRKAFATSCTLAHLDNVTPHTLRHTCITWLVQKGIALWEVSGFCGATTETIERTYGHHSPDYLRNAASALS